MVDNPYSKIIQQMKKQGKTVNSPSIQIGRVVSPKPLTVQIGDLQIDMDNILISDCIKDELIKDDGLAILPTSDRQTYIILAKVVRP